MEQDPTRPNLNLNLYTSNNSKERNKSLDYLQASDYLGEAPDFGKSVYDNPLTPRQDIQSGDYKYLRGEQQNAMLQTGAGILRIGAKMGIEMAKTPAYLYSLGEWSLDNIKEGGKGMSLADALDNSMLKVLDNVEESYKEALPVYQSYKAGKGGLWDNIMSTSFWTSEGADGVGYLLGMMGTSGLIGTAKLGSKLAKVGIKKGLAKNLDSGTQVLVNTMAESLAEAKGVVDNLKARGASDEEIANAARETFLSNMVLVAGPNILMHKNLLGRFKNEKNILDDFRDASGKLVSNPVVKKSLLKEYGKKIGYSALTESGEEGGQSAIQNYEQNYTLGKTKDGFFEGVAKEFIEGFSSLESQKAMLLGAVLGAGGGAFGQYQENKSDNTRKSAISDLIKKNYSSFNVTDNIYETDEQGAIKFNEANEPIINPKSLQKHIQNIASMLKDSQLKDLAAFNNDKTLYDFIAHKQFTEWALPFLAQGETGLEIANELIDQASNTQFLINQKDLSQTPSFEFSETQYKNEQKQLLKNMLKTYDRTSEVIADIPLLSDITKSNPQEANRFINQLYASLFKEISKQEFYVNKLRELNNELNEFTLGLTADLPHNQKQIKKLQSDIAGISNLLQQSKDTYNKLFDEEEVKTAWDEHLKQVVKEDKVVETAEKEVKKTEKAEQKQREFNEELQAQFNEAKSTDSLEVFDTYFEKIKNNPYYNTEELKQLDKKRKSLLSIIDILANRMIKGQQLITPEEIQFYTNNKTLIENKIKEIKDKKDKEKLPTLNELTGVEGEDYYEGAENKPGKNDSELISEANSGIISDTDITQKPTSESKPDKIVTDKTLATQTNVVMMHLFDHYFDSLGNFRFKRNGDGQPELDNVSKINIKVLNETKEGDTVELRLLPFEQDVLNLYKDLKDFDGENIGIFKDNDLIGFVQQPHPIDTNVSNVNEAEHNRNNLIIYRKRVIANLKSGKPVTETIIEKGTGNLYTKLNKQGLIDPIFNVLNTIRPQDKIEGLAIFVYGNSNGKLTLPQDTELSEEALKQVNERLAALRHFNVQPGKIFQLVYDLTGQLNVIPVYANKVDAETGKAINDVLKTHSNSSDPFEIIRELQPYIYAANSIRKGKAAMVVTKNDDGKITLWANGNTISLDEYNTSKEKRNTFLLGIKDNVKQNIDRNIINTKLGQESMTSRNTLLTNVTTFEGEYFVQPYLSYTQSLIDGINDIKKSTITEEQTIQAVQPTADKTTSLEDKVKAKLNKYKDSSLDEDALSRTKDVSKLNREQFKTWLANKLPQLSLSDITSLNELKDTLIDALGLFRDSTIYLFEDAGTKTAYHEAFHGVFRNLLTVEQREDIINEAVKKYKAPTNQELNSLKEGLKGRYSTEQLTYLYYEEQLADDFAKYTYDRNDASLLTRITKKIIDFFNKIFDYFRIFKTANTSTIDDVFNSVNTGKFATINSTSNSVVNRSLFNEYAYSRLDKELGVSRKAKFTESIGNELLARLQKSNFSGKDVSFLDLSNDILKIYKQKFAETTDEKVEKVLAKVILNYPELVNTEVKKYLAYRGLIIKGELKYNAVQEEVIRAEQEDNIITDNNLEPEKKNDVEIYTLDSKTTKSYGQEWTSISGIDSASKRIKLFLSSIPVLDENNNQVLDAYDMPIYHDFSVLYYYIESNLIDKYTFEEQIAKLKELSSIRPEIKQVIDMLTVKPSDMTQEEFTMLQNDFKANYSKQQLPYTLVLFNTDSKTGKVTYKIIDANRTALGLELYNDWVDNLYDPTKNNLGNYDDEGNPVVDKEGVKKLLASWKELTKRKTALKYEVTNKLLNKIGIEFSPEVLVKLLKENTETFKLNVENYLNYLAADYKPALEQTGRLALGALVNEELTNTKNRYTSSFINNENKNIYTIQLPSYISKKVTKLTDLKKFKAYREELIRDPYWRNASILKDYTPGLDNYMTFANRAYRELFRISYLDGLKDEIGNKEGVSFTDMNPKDFMSMQLALFQNEGSQRITSIPSNKYIYITPSDKTMCVVIDSTSYRATLAEDGINLDIQKSPILKAFYNNFLQEALRIRHALDVKNDILTNKGDGKYRLDSLLEHSHMSKNNFSKYSKLISEKSVDELDEKDWADIESYFDGQAFKFNSFTGSYNSILRELLKDIMDNSTVDNLKNNLESVKGKIVDIIANQLKNEYKDILDEAVEKGVITKTKEGFYKNISLQLTDQFDAEGNTIANSEQLEHNRITNLMLNYALNSYLHNLEFSSLFNGDITQYKPGDIQKRTYQSQAMLVDGKFENPIIKTLVVKDVEEDSKTINNLRQELINQGYSEEVVNNITKKYDSNNVTDAQVFITPELFKRISQSRGIWNDDLQEAYDVAEGLKVGDDAEAIHRLLSAFKPYYYGERFDETLGIYRNEQVKCSMLPLFKNYLDMNPLLKAKYEDMKSREIDMIAFESAFKGAIGYRSDITDNINGVVLDLNTDNFGIQVDNPDHMDDGNDSMRQFKMLIAGIIDTTKMYNGKSGQKIFDEIMQMESENIESSLKDLMTKMDVKNNINFATFIKDMVTKRGASLTVETILNVVNGNFEYALDNGIASTQVENMISSIFTNNVIKQLFNVGGSAVQASSLGFEYSNLKEQQENLSDEALEVQSKLKWINSVDGKLTRVQCAMPAWTKDFFDNGVLKDINNIPEELKQLIAYRIPTEGLHSMLSLEVVEFLPATMGNFMLLPVEITTQLGADFDFDKVYFFGKEYYKDIDNDGNIKLKPFQYSEDDNSLNERWLQYLKYTSMYQLPQKYNDIYEFKAAPIKEQNVRASRNNKLIENYDLLLTTKENLKLMVTPSGFEDLANAKNSIITTDEKYNKSSFFSSKTQRDLKERNHIGVALKGQWALHVTGHSYSTRMGLNTYSHNKEGLLDTTKTVNLNGENRYEFNKLYTDNGNLISDELAKILAGVLDDIKDPLLQYLGIDNNTSDVLATIVRAGYDLDLALYFGAQPGLKSASTLLSTNKAKIKSPNQGIFTVDNVITAYKAQSDALYEKLTDEDKSKIKTPFLDKERLRFYAKHFRIVNGEVLKGYPNDKGNLKFRTPSDFELYDYLIFQTKVLEQFEIIKPIADELVKVNKFFAINKEVGPNIEDIIGKRDILEDIKKSNILYGFNINTIPALKATWQAHETALNWFESYFPYSTQQYEKVKVNIVTSQFNKSLNEVPIEDRELMNHFIRVYTDTLSSEFFKSIPDEKPYLLFDLPKLIDNIKKASNVDNKLGSLTYGQIRENLFIQNIKSRYDEKNRVKYLELKGNRLDLQVKNNVINSFKILYNNPDTKKLAEDILKHSYLTTGFYKGVKSFANLLHPEVLKTIGETDENLGYNNLRKELIRNFKENTVYFSIEDINLMKDQLIRNYPNKFTKKFDAIMFNLDETKSLPNKIETDKNLAKNSNRLNDIYWTKTIDQETIEYNPQYISIYDKVKHRSELFKLVAPWHWVKVSALGKPNRLLEIYPNKYLDKSILKNNNPVEEQVEKTKSEVFESTEKPLNEQSEDNKITTNLFSETNKPTDSDLKNINLEKIDFSKIINHSGGALGADSEWDNIGVQFGMINNKHYWYGTKTPKGNVELSVKELEEGWQHVLEANKTLKRKPYAYKALLSRNWFQVKNSDAVFAISTINWDNEQKTGVVNGGTGWAVQMAIDNNKPVYVFDQNTNLWYEWQKDKKEGDGWITTNTPVLTQNFAGIGTREINDNGKKAIESVYKKTLNNLNLVSPSNKDTENKQLNLFTEEGTDQNKEC